MDIVNDAKKAIYYIDEDYDNASKVNSRLKRGLFSTNENLSYIKDIGVNNENVLTICGSGDHSFISLINGAKRVDTFDYNPLQYYVMELKRAAIMGLSKEDYLKYFPIFGGNINEMYNIKYYKIIRDYLHKEAREFWDRIYSTNNHRLYLLQFSTFHLDSGSDYTMNYDILKNKLYQDSINFYYDDVRHVSKSFNKNTYKLIILSNVFDHIYHNREYIERKNNEEEYLELVRNSFIPLLTDDGSCVFHYQLDCMDLKSFDEYEGNKVKIMTK